MKKILIILIIALTILISGCIGTSNIDTQITEDKIESAMEQIYNSDPAMKLVGKEASDFTVKDLLTGNTYTKQDFSGKVLIINSFATWCPSCAEEVIKFDAIKGKYGDRVEIIYLTVDPKETRETILNQLRRVGGKGNWIFAYDERMLADYGIDAPDMTFMVKDGKFIYGDSLVAPLKRLEKFIEQALRN